MERCLFVGGPWDGRIEKVHDAGRPLVMPARTDEIDDLVVRPPETEVAYRRLFNVRYHPARFRDERGDFVVMVSEGSATPTYKEARRLWHEAEHPAPPPPEWAVPRETVIVDHHLLHPGNPLEPDFVTLLKALLVEESGYSPEEADRLVKAHPSVVMQGIMGGPFVLRATAMALEMADERRSVT